jgi:hypothetical protein
MILINGFGVLAFDGQSTCIQWWPLVVLLDQWGLFSFADEMAVYCLSEFLVGLPWHENVINGSIADSLGLNHTRYIQNEQNVDHNLVLGHGPHSAVTRVPQALMISVV